MNAKNLIAPIAALAIAAAVLLGASAVLRPMAEEREDWADLLKRLDRWIEALRGELPESERVPRTEAAGDRTDEYKM